MNDNKNTYVCIYSYFCEYFCETVFYLKDVCSSRECVRFGNKSTNTVASR